MLSGDSGCDNNDDNDDDDDDNNNKIQAVGSLAVPVGYLDTILEL
jgi:hypothetical protein